MPTHLDSIFFHWSLSSLLLCLESTALVRGSTPTLSVRSFLQPTLFCVPLPLPDMARFQVQKPFVWFHAKTDKGIVCLAGHLYSVTLKYTGDSVVQVRTFINFLTSEFGSSTREERDTILKSLSYHTMLTPPPTFGTSRCPISISQPYCRAQLLTIMVRLQFNRHRNSRELNSLCLNSRLNCPPAWSNLKSSTSTVCH